jgi:hypothetical protein
MARRRREQSPSNIKLKQPDRSGPSEKTLLELAEERGLFDLAEKREEQIGKKAAPAPVPIPRAPKEKGGDGGHDGEDGLSPTAERVFETLLWSVSLAMLHMTLDVLVYHQYSIDSIVWPRILLRFGQALLGELWISSVVVLLAIHWRHLANLWSLFPPSFHLAYLLPPSPRRKPWPRTWSLSKTPVRYPPSHFLYHEHSRRLLLDPHHELVWLHGHHEAGPVHWLPLGVVRH